MKKTKLERVFQAKLIKELKKKFPGCIILKLDSSYIQGIPDLLVLWGKTWAALEIKRSATAHRQPNQEFYVSRLNQMSFAKFIFPENKEDVLRELEQKAEHVTWNKDRRKTWFVLFSMGGFTDDLCQLAKTRSDLLLVDDSISAMSRICGAW